MRDINYIKHIDGSYSSKQMILLFQITILFIIYIRVGTRSGLPLKHTLFQLLNVKDQVHLELIDKYKNAQKDWIAEDGEMTTKLSQAVII